MLYFGANIKEHRMKKGLTQEQLAYHFGVSSQTVSRWESGTTYPDIVMLPILADYFGISIDMLVGYAKECEAEERERFFSDIKDLEILQKINKIRDMLQTYPNDVYLQFSLANTLYSRLIHPAAYNPDNDARDRPDNSSKLNSSPTGIQKQEDPDIEKEIRQLCDRILQSDQPEIQCGAIRLLALLSAGHGDVDSAMKYVNKLPSVYCGREILAEKVLHGLNFRQAVRKLYDL